MNKAGKNTLRDFKPGAIVEIAYSISLFRLEAMYWDTNNDRVEFWPMTIKKAGGKIPRKLEDGRHAIFMGAFQATTYVYQTLSSGKTEPVREDPREYMLFLYKGKLVYTGTCITELYNTGKNEFFIYYTSSAGKVECKPWDWFPEHARADLTMIKGVLEHAAVPLHKRKVA